MNTEFFTLTDLQAIKGELEKGDEATINRIINELDRLQDIIKDYELGFSILDGKFNKTSNQKPQTYPIICKYCKSPAKDWPDLNRRTCNCGALGYDVPKT